MPHADLKLRQNYQEKYREENREALREYFRSYNRERSKSPKERRRCQIKDLKRWHGLDREEAEAVIERKQKGCEVCGSITERMHLDHDHESGRIRGILCRDCNLALGLVKDSTEVLRKLAVYLEAAELT